MLTELHIIFLLKDACIAHKIKPLITFISWIKTASRKKKTSKAEIEIGKKTMTCNT